MVTATDLTRTTTRPDGTILEARYYADEYIQIARLTDESTHNTPDNPVGVGDHTIVLELPTWEEITTTHRTDSYTIHETSDTVTVTLTDDEIEIMVHDTTVTLTEEEQQFVNTMISDAKSLLREDGVI